MITATVIDNLKRERARVLAESRSIVHSIPSGRQPDAETRMALSRAETELSDLTREIEHAESELRAQHVAAEARAGVAHVVMPGGRYETRQSPLSGLLTGETRALDINLARGRSEYRDLVTGTAATAGNLVPTSMDARIARLLEDLSPLRRAGARIVSTPHGHPHEMPRVTTKSEAAATDEAAALSESDPEFDTVTLGAWKYSQLLQVSSEMAADTETDLMGFLEQDMTEALARQTSEQYANGDGSTEPHGYCVAAPTASAVTGAAAAAGVPSYENLVDVMWSVNSAYRSRGSWLISDLTAAQLMKNVDLDGRPIWTPSLLAGQPDLLLGRPVFVDSYAPSGVDANSVHYGDWGSAFVIRDAGSLRLERSDDFAFDHDLITFRALLRTDSKVLRPQAFARFTGGAVS